MRCAQASLRAYERGGGGWLQKTPLTRARTFPGKGRGGRPLKMIKKYSKHPTAPGPEGWGGSRAGSKPVGSEHTGTSN